MRLQILTLLCSLSIFVLATNKFEDKSNIEDVITTFPILVDSRETAKLGTILTPNVTYETSTGPIQGLPAVISFFSALVPTTTTTYSISSTRLIKFLQPFDKEGRSNSAEAVSYSTIVSFGSGNLTDESYFIFARIVDKKIVRTNERVGLTGGEFSIGSLNVS